MGKQQKAVRKKPGPAPTGKTPMRAMRVPDEEWSSWRKEAERRGMSLTALVRKSMSRYCK